MSQRQLLALVVGRALGLAPLLQSVVDNISMRNTQEANEKREMLIHGGAIAFSPFEATEKKKNIPRNNILVLPADLVAETANSAELAAGLQTEDTESLGNNDLLLLVVGGRDTLEDLESLKSGSAAGGLVRDHAADGLVEDSRGGTEVEGT